MAVQFRASSAGSAAFSTTRSPTLTKPAGVTDGDLIYVAFVSGTDHTRTTPAGWTAVGNVQTSTDNDGCISIIKRVASGEPASWTFTSYFAANESGIVGCVAYFGDGGGTLQDAAAPVGRSYVYDPSSTFTTGSITPDSDGCRVVAFYGVDPWQSPWVGTPDSSPACTERLDANSGTGSGTDDGWVYVQDFLQSTAAAVSLDVITSNGDSGGNIIVALKEVAGGTTTVGASLAQPAAIRTLKAASLAQPAAVRTLRAASLSQPAVVRALKAASLAQPAAVRAFQGASLAQPARVRNLAGATLAQQAAIHVLAGASLDQQTLIRTLAGASAAQVATLRALAGLALDQSAAIRELAGASLQQRANIALTLITVGASLDQPAPLRALAGASLDQQAVVRALVAASLTQDAQVRALVGASLDQRAALLLTVAAGLAQPATIRQLAGASIQQAAFIRLLVGASLSQSARVGAALPGPGHIVLAAAGSIDRGQPGHIGPTTSPGGVT